MDGSPRSEQQFCSVKRTLCIGLGGTGRDILMRIRRLIIDRYSKLSKFPIVSFVHIDADKGASQISGLRTGSIYHGEELLFSDAEKVVAAMNSQEVNDLVHGLERRSSYEREGPYDHIGCWFSPQLLRNIKAIENGASGIRPVGRLAFFHNYRQIRRAVEAAETRTRGHERELLSNGFIVEPGLNLFVVGSLCGGTGSGMFLDIAYSLRQLYSGKENQIVGYFVISPELYGDTPDMNANTYAALKELNYFAAENTKFEACYDPQHLVQVSEKRPPFDFVYLVSNQTVNDYKIIEKNKLCNVIAHKVFIDFADELAPIIQGQKNNFLDKLSRTDEHPRRNVQRYLTFGLAKIYFPRDLTVQVSLNRTKIKLLSFWINGEGQSPDTQAILDRFLLNWRSGREGKDLFTLKLEEAVRDSNKTFLQTISHWKSQIEQRIAACQSQSDRQRLVQQLLGDFRSQFRKVQPGDTESNRGMWLTTLQQSSPRIAEDLKRDIAQFLGELLGPSNADFSLTITRAFLEALQAELNQYQRNLTEKSQNLSDLYSIEDLERKWNNAKQIVQDIEAKRSFLAFADRRNSQFQEEVQRALQDVYGLLEHNFTYVLQQEALKIVGILQHFVQQMETQASHFANLLRTLISNYEQRSNALEHLNEDEINGEAIFTREDSDACYRGLLPESERRSQLVAITAKISEQVGMGASLIDFLTRERLIDAKQLQEKIDETVEALFGSLSLSVVQSVVNRFLQKYPFSDGETRFAQILREAELLLPLNLNASYYYNEPGKSFKIVGFKNTEEREIKQFRALLSRNLGISDTAIKPTQTESEVVIINEYAAFPLRLIGNLPQMREQYHRRLKYEAALLHIDCSQQFTDIIPPDARKLEELQDIFYTCLAFGLLEENLHTQKYELQYYDELRNVYETTELSYVWNEALEQLANLQDLTRALTALKEKAIDEIRTNSRQWEIYYLPKLRAFVTKTDRLPEDDPNYAERATVVGTRATLDTTAKEGIIVRILRHVQEEVLQKAKVKSDNAVSSKMLSSSSVIEGESTNPRTYNESKFADAELEDTSYLPQAATGELSQSSNSGIQLKGSELLAELNKLALHREQGILTDEEFQVIKKQIIKELS